MSFCTCFLLGVEIRKARRSTLNIKIKRWGLKTPFLFVIFSLALGFASRGDWRKSERKVLSKAREGGDEIMMKMSNDNAKSDGKKSGNK